MECKTIPNVQGLDRYFSFGVKMALEEIFNEDRSLHEMALVPDIWIFTENVLTNIVPFVKEKYTGRPCIIFGTSLHQRIFSGVPGFTNMLFVPIHASFHEVKNKLGMFLRESRRDIYPRIKPISSAFRGYSFTPGERKTLSLLLSGSSPRDVAEINNVSEKTVSNYKRMAMRRFNVKNTQELVVKSQLLGMCHSAMINWFAIPGNFNDLSAYKWRR